MKLFTKHQAIMKQLRILALVLLAVICPKNLFAQTDSVEVFIIESFISQENPGIFALTFNTSIPSKSKILIDGKYLLPLSDSLTDTHSKKFDISKLKFDSSNVTFKAILTDSLNKTNESDSYEIYVPREVTVESKNATYFSCFYGGIVYLIPNISMNLSGRDGKLKNYWGLSKEFPLLSHYQGGYNFPKSYLSAEYSHVLKFEDKNFLRLGYKFLFETNFGEFFTVGLNGVYDFKQFKGIAPEVSWGILPIRDVFTLTLKYRYNKSFAKPTQAFSEISLGLCSWFFSAHI